MLWECSPEQNPALFKAAQLGLGCIGLEKSDCGEKKSDLGRKDVGGKVTPGREKSDSKTVRLKVVEKARQMREQSQT